MSIEIQRINVSVIDGTRPWATAAFNIPLVLGTSVDPEAVKDTLKRYTSDDLVAVAADFPVTTPEYKTVAKILAQDVHPDTVYVFSVTRGATPAPEDLSAAILEAKRQCEAAQWAEFYFIVPTEREEVEGDLEEMADTVSAMTAIMVTANEVGATPSQIKAVCEEIASDRVVIIAHDDPDEERPDAATVGYWAGMPIGSITLDAKPLNGVSAASWTASQLAELMPANPYTDPAAIPYVKQAGVAVLCGSWTTNGAPADMRRDKDWLVATMKETLFGLKLQHGKIPQTQRGLNMVHACIEGVLVRADEMGVLQKRGGTGAGRWEIDIPTLEWLALNDPQALASRHLKTIRIRVWPQGAFEAFTVLVYMNWSLEE